MDEREPPSTHELIACASNRGVLSRRSVEILQQTWVVDEIDEALEDSYGIESAGHLLLMTIMPDDSGSMFGRKQQGVISGHNDLLHAMQESSMRERTLFQTRYLNRTILNPFQPLALCRELNEENYPCDHGTPLFRETIVTLGTVMAKTEELLTDGAARVRTATLIMTDAQDTGSRQVEMQAEIASIIADMQRVGDHIVAAMGFSSGDDEEFRKTFRNMGIDDKLIFTASSREDILKAFRVFAWHTLELTVGTSEARRVLGSGSV